MIKLSRTGVGAVSNHAGIHGSASFSIQMKSYCRRRNKCSVLAQYALSVATRP